MTFSEVTFELADARHVLCQLTRGTGAHIVLRTIDSGEGGQRQRMHVTVHGPPETALALQTELAATSPDTRMEIANTTATLTTAWLDVPLDAPRATPDIHAILPALTQGASLAISDPLVASEGRIRGRVVIPRAGEPEEILRALQTVQRASGFSEFKILRLAALTPAAHIETTRRALPVEQETLLALAASMGYYRTPKIVTLEEISRAVGLSISPVHKRLKAAEESIIRQHVAPTGGDASRRRPRTASVRAGATSPSEVQIRVKGDLGPARLLEEHASTRASLHPLTLSDPEHQSYVLVVHAEQDVQEKILASLADRPEVTHHQVIDRSASHVVCRVRARGKGPYSLAAWGAVWGPDAAMRAAVIEGGEVYIRALVTRSHTFEELQERAQEYSRAAGWEETELVAQRSLAEPATPPGWPEPLTQRQVEVLHIAHALGYYKTPRGCTLGNVATTLGVSANAIHKNLVLAESKLIAAYLAAGL